MGTFARTDAEVAPFGDVPLTKATCVEQHSHVRGSRATTSCDSAAEALSNKELGTGNQSDCCPGSPDVRAVGLLDLDQDCLQAVMALLGSPAAALRFASTCRTMRRVLRDAGPGAPLFRDLALRTWNPTFADVRTYGGDWQRLCLDDNARNAVASTSLNVPVSALRWPEDSAAEYRPHRAEVKLADCDFQVSVGFLFHQERRLGSNMDVAFEVTSDVQEAPLPVHILMTLNRRQPCGQPSDDEEDLTSRHMFSTFCEFNSSNTLLLFKNLASCSTLLTERLGYLHDLGDTESCHGKGASEGLEEEEEGLKYIQLKIDVLRIWDSSPSRIAAQMRGGSSSNRRRVPMISCNCGPTADLCCPESAIKAILRRCWSTSPQVRDVAWRYLRHLVSSARFHQQDKLEKFCRVLAALGAVKLLLVSCADTDLEVATTALQIICTMADVEESAEVLQQQRAIEVMTKVNLTTEHRSIRRGTGEAIASLVPLDGDGLAIIRSLKLL